MPEGCMSYRWTNPEEEWTIKRENVFLKARGEMVRVSHTSTCSYEKYIKKSGTERLIDALYLGADGSAQKIVQEGLDVQEVTLRVEYDESSLFNYAGMYLSFLPMLETDLKFREEVITHKNRALYNVVITLVQKHPAGHKLADRIIEIILQFAAALNRQDVLPFVEDLRRKI